MSKRTDLVLIDKAFNTLEHALASKNDFATFYEQNLKEERGHRNFGRGFGANAISAPQAARLFCVRQIAEYLNGDPAPDVANIFHHRLSSYQAYALVANYRERIAQSLEPFDLQALLALDYAELNKVA